MPSTPIVAPRPRPRSTFKQPALPINPYTRPTTPEAPRCEPLSPPRSVEPTFNSSTIPPPPAWTQKPSPIKSQSSRNDRRHPRSTPFIETPAQAALSTSPQLTPAASLARSTPDNFITPDLTRGTKRARSDAGPGPQAYAFSARPSSSHHLSNPGAHPLAYNTDRQRRQSTNTAIVTSLEDAELLLNFAGRVASRPPPPLDPPSHHAPSSSSAIATGFYSVPPAPPVQPSLPTPVPLYAAPLLNQSPAHAPSVISDHASASLPSPQGTSEDDKSMDLAKDIAQVSGSDLAPTATVPEPSTARALQQTQTPPEEERSIPLLIKDAAEQPTTSVEIQQSLDTPAARPRRGWPKGKPRGPRNKTSVATKPRSAARRSRASTAKSAAESIDSSAEEKRVRRKSDSEFPLLHGENSVLRPGDSRAGTVPPSLRYEILPLQAGATAAATVPTSTARKSLKQTQETVCASCAKTRESSHGELDQWISCNGCQLWFHYDCAGFKNERDVRDVGKFFCKSCEPHFGPTTFVRKSSRAHAAVDYAGLNQGILKTSDDNPEHHYIQPIKDGSLTFDPEMFPRMRPELVTREFFETCAAFSEPVVIPAEFNPKLPRPRSSPPLDSDDVVATAFRDGQEEDALTDVFEYETVFDDGQDRLDMVVPRDLTVRHVAELVGPGEPLEVIDVKTQGTEGKWNLAKWADYYEADGEKAVRNVISLEVSSTKLGRLLRRPKVVRDIDLQDSVWPDEETAKGIYPKVQFYCLMSVADSFTDFHIDFGGSSVYYHILRGKKTFFFIPPKPGHLKKYEDWNNSHEQNFTWLPDATKECYRVDLSAGDTMLIPSGWIHAVWTPENSLVIGGNFLTRMHYSTQFRIVDIEKAIKTPQKFRYPHFQKVMWYTVIKYLETDPLPAEVAQTFYSGAKFVRERPVWEEFDQHGENFPRASGSASYNCRYYSQAELDGLPDLVNFIFRTVMISLGRIEGVTEDTRKKVTKSIPKSRGEPLELARTFALWVAWKRGNEDPPAWAHPDADLPDKESAAPKKLSARALKAMQRQEAFEAYRAAPERQSARQYVSREPESVAATSPGPSLPPLPASQTQTTPGPGLHHTSTPKTSVLGPKRVACDACRKRRIKCKHKDIVTTASSFGHPGEIFHSTPSLDGAGDAMPYDLHRRDSRDFFAASTVSPVKLPEQVMQITPFAQSEQNLPMGYNSQIAGIAPMAQMTLVDTNGPAHMTGNALLADPNSKRGRSKACLDCRKSKRRCIHDEAGKIDPVKAEQTPVPRGTVIPKKRRTSGEMEGSIKKAKQSRPSQGAPVMPFSMEPAYQPNVASPQRYKQYSYAAEANISHWPNPSYMYPDPTSTNGNVVLPGGPYHQQADLNGSYNAQSLEQLANDVLDSRYVNDGDYTVPQPNNDSMLHPALQQLSSVSSQSVGHEQLSPLFSKVQPSSTFLNQPLESSHLPVSSSRHGAEGSAEATKNARQDIKAAQPVVGDAAAHAQTSKGVGPPLEKTVHMTGLATIPLYQPPAPPLTKSQGPKMQRHSFSVDKNRSLSKTPQPGQIMDTSELKTPGSNKHKRDSVSATPGTAKSNKHELVTREKSTVEEEDEQSVRLARELQDQDWGLRRRSRG